MTSYLDVPVLTSGNITCKAVNTVGETTVTQEFFVYEMDNGFGIVDKENAWFSENQSVKLKCVAAKCDFVNVTWTSDDAEDISGNGKKDFFKSIYTILKKFIRLNLIRQPVLGADYLT